MAHSAPEKDENKNQNFPIGVDKNFAVMNTWIASTDDHENPTKRRAISQRSSFTAPNLSASSSAVSPRTKISTERNAISSSSSSSRGSNPPDFCPRASNLEEMSQRQDTDDLIKYHQFRVPEDVRPDFSGEIDASSTKPYDPVSNCYVPRPKYLRYNPDRRLQVLLNRQRRLKTELASFLDSVKDVNPSSDNSSGSSSYSNSGSLSDNSSGSLPENGSESPNTSASEAKIITKQQSMDNHVVFKGEAVPVDSQKVENEKPSDNTCGSSNDEMISECKETNSKRDVVPVDSQSVDDDVLVLSDNIFGSSKAFVPKTELDSESKDAFDNEDVEEEKLREGNGGWKCVLLKLFLVLIVWGLSTAYISTMNSSSPPPVLKVGIYESKSEGRSDMGTFYEKASEIENVEGDAENSVTVDESGNEILDNPGILFVVAPDFEDHEGTEKSIAVDHTGDGYGGSPEREDLLPNSTSKQDKALDESDVVVDHERSCNDVVLDLNEDTGKVILLDPDANESDITSDSGNEFKSDLLEQLEEEQLSQKKSCIGINRIQDNGLETDQSPYESGTANDPANELTSDLLGSGYEEVYAVDNRVKDEFSSHEGDVTGNIEHNPEIGLSRSAGIISNNLIWVSIVGFLTAFGFYLVMRLYLSCKATSTRSDRPKKIIKFDHPRKDRSLMKTPLDNNVLNASSYKLIPHLAQEKTEAFQNTYTPIPPLPPSRWSSGGFTSDVRLLGEVKMGDISGSLIRSSYDFAAAPAVRDKAWEIKQGEENKRSASSIRFLPEEEKLQEKYLPPLVFGSFINQEKIVKKQEAKRAPAAASMTITPVRRSTRLQNRGAVSP